MVDWHHRTLERAADLDPEPPRLPAAEAQRWANFIVFVPGWLPPGCSAREGTLRREAPPGRAGEHTAGRTPWSENNPAAYRLEIAGEGRRLRLKEFLYDWAFPALDHPCLWMSETRAVPLDQEHVLWYGTDYMGHPAASARMARTMIELSVLDGAFTDEELLAIYRALHPVDEAAADAIGRAPLATLSYWARRPLATTVEVPIGLWKPGQAKRAKLVWHAGAEAAARAAADAAPASLGGLDLDSLAEETAGAGPTRTEVVYSGGRRRGRELRLQLQRGPASGPPLREGHPGRTEELGNASGRVYLAWIDERFGPFDAIMADGDGCARLLSSAGVGLDRAWFLGAVAALGRGAPA